MKFPKLSELDKDQARIYQGAPTTGTIMVLGPPGTGKTVIAFHRAHVLQKLKRDPRVVMYNKVLATYTSNRNGVAESVDVKTFHKWVYEWWKKAVPGGNGPPMVPGDRFSFDWSTIQNAVLSRMSNFEDMKGVNWGHLIVDEGQDFPSAMYNALKVVQTFAEVKGADPAPGITVLADENQRLQLGKNSTIEDIRMALGLHEADKNVFILKKNYRNTLEIAAFAAQFYVGLKTGIPEMPTRRGSAPVVSTSGKDSAGKNLDAFCAKIARFAMNRRTDEIGVLVPNDKTRKSVVNRLTKKLEGKDMEIQTYASSDETTRAEDLVFDSGGHITVLNYQSAKGLEFDAVFVVDPSQLLNGGASELSAKMYLYVMCSRARGFLNVMLVQCSESDTIKSWLSAGSAKFESEDL